MNLNARQPGLSSLLDLVTEGRVPSTLLDTIQGVFDPYQFVALAKRERIVTSASPAGTFNGNWSFAAPLGGQVPDSEAWLLNGYTIRAAVAAGTTVAVIPTVQLRAGAGYEAYRIPGECRIVNATLGGQITAGGVYTDPYFLPPGSILGGFTSDLSAATAFNAIAHIDIVRIRV